MKVCTPSPFAAGRRSSSTPASADAEARACGAPRPHHSAEPAAPASLEKPGHQEQRRDDADDAIFRSLIRFWGADWRWSLALDMAAGKRLLYADSIIRAGGGFLWRYGIDAVPALHLRHQADIMGAIALERNPELSQAAKVMVLGDMPRREIAQRLGVEPATVERWEQLFFDVRDRLEAVYWLHAFVIRPEERRGNHEHARDLRCALHGGAAAVRYQHEVDAPIPADAPPVMRLHLACEKLSKKATAALSIAMDSPQGAIRIVMAATRLLMANKKIDAQLKRQKQTQKRARNQLRRDLEAAKAEIARLNEQLAAMKTASLYDLSPTHNTHIVGRTAAA